MLLLASRLAETQMLYLDVQWPRVRLVPLLLALGIVAAVRGAGRLSLGLLVLGGVVASVYWSQGFPLGANPWGTAIVLTPHRLAADISDYLTPLLRAPQVVPVVLAIALLLSQVSLRTARRPWSWRLAAALVLAPVVLQLLMWQTLFAGYESPLHMLVTVWVPRIGLPGVLLLGLSLIAADPRPALGAALYAACSLLTALSLHAAYGGYPFSLWQSELLTAAVIGVAGVAVAAQAVARRRRLARL